MLPCSHPAPINAFSADLHPSPLLLADAISDFISSSSRLEDSYRDLQQEVSQLGRELVERNAALGRSVAENDRMRVSLQQIIDSMPCGVLVMDSAGGIVMINPAGRKLLELGTEPIGSLRELSTKCQIDFEMLAAGSSDNSDRELCIPSSAGKRWLAIGNRKLSCEAVSQQRESEGAPLQNIWILRDVTASKLAEQEREAARNAMALAEISTVLAHEIRNPLASMELFAGLIAEDPGQSSQWISHLRAGIRLLSGTVNNVLSMHGAGFPHLVPVDLNVCIRSGVEFVQPIAEQAGVSLSFVSQDKDLAIRGNENGLRQIILNLICNAIRHTPAGGTIAVATRRLSSGGVFRALVEIKDSGAGIPAHMIKQIFDVGFSANSDTPGLGLAVCKRLMKQHEGEIRVSSRVNLGSTFQLEFPIL